MNSETKGWCFFFACATIAISVIAGCITYNSVEYNKMVERVIKSGVSPAVMACIDTGWDSIATHAICSKVLTNHKLTREEAEKLIEGLK